jgi:outer membrane protein OmpA-like peptidoglycan-associated protein
MANKVRVFGKAQNRTALGIANAYLVIYPHATLEDLNKAFPIALNSSNRSKTIFVDIKDREKFTTAKASNSTFEMFFFEKPDEVLKLKDGTIACMLELWTKPDFEKIVNHAKKYDIEVADYKPREPFGKGGFWLEYLPGFTPKKSKWWLWLLLGLLLLALILFFLLRKTPEPVVVERIVEKEVIVKDTVYVQQLAEIEKNFNAAQFEMGKSNLSEDAKFVLHDLAKLLNQNPELKLRIVGHTSKEGTEDSNQKLSEARAKAAVDFLVKERNIDASRLEFKGVGSSQPLDPNQLDINRRTEFIVIE